jgi:glycerol-3-phosphate dehydrogenase
MTPVTDLDLIVVGGGINGAAVVRDAALRGLRVHLIERRDLCYGTSAGSTRLIHGGLRYLEHLELGLVHESLRERQLLLDQRPWRVNELTLQLLVQDGDPHGLGFLRLGLWAYEAMAGRPFAQRVSRLSAEACRSTFPLLRPDGLRGGLSYVDAQVRYPERLVVELTCDAVAAGASLETGTGVETLLFDDGRVVGVCLDDGRCLYAPLTINATGHWVDDLMGRSRVMVPRLLHTTRGSHVMLPRRPQQPAVGIYTAARSDGRPFFIIPWGNSLWVGTTDIFQSDPDTWYATDEEIDYLISETNKLLPKASYRREEVILTRCGIRPLVRSTSTRGQKEGAVSRAHRVAGPGDAGGYPGLLQLLGGKLTTHRSLAEEAVTAAQALLGKRRKKGVTRSKAAVHPPLPDAVHLPLEAGLAERLHQVYGPYARPMLDDLRQRPELANPLVEGLPVIGAEVVHAFTREWAKNLDDFFARRCMLTTEELPWHEHSKELADAVGTLLKWGPDRMEEEHQAWLQALANHDPFSAKKVLAHLS